jgi:hypothetical protein
MKRAPRSLQHHVLYRKYNGQDSEISALLGKCGLMAKNLAYELVLKMVISTQFVRVADDPKDEDELLSLARSFIENISDAARQEARNVPDKEVARFVLSVMDETVAKLYTDAARQVSRTSSLYFAKAPSNEKN